MPLLLLLPLEQQQSPLSELLRQLLLLL